MGLYLISPVSTRYSRLNFSINFEVNHDVRASCGITGFAVSELAVLRILYDSACVFETVSNVLPETILPFGATPHLTSEPSLGQILCGMCMQYVPLMVTSIALQRIALDSDSLDYHVVVSAH